MKRQANRWADAACHPIAWFSALLRGIDRNDTPLIDRALHELDALGFRIHLAKPREAKPTLGPHADGRKGGVR